MEKFQMAIIALAAVLVGLAKGLVFVREGELGSRTTFGKAKRGRDKKIIITDPGFVILIPFIHSMQKAHIRMDSVVLKDLAVTLGNGLSYQYSAFVAYHVSPKPEDLEKFLYQVENPKELISQKLSSEMREILVEEQDPEKAKGEGMNSKLAARLKDYLLNNIGVTLDSCGLTSLTESAQAQQFGVSVAKYKYVKENLFKDVTVPETVAAACFGALPTVAPMTVAQKEDQKEFKEQNGKTTSTLDKILNELTTTKQQKEVEKKEN